MSIDEVHVQAAPPAPDQGPESPPDFARRREALLRQVLALREYREQLRQQRSGFEQERRLYQQERLRLWQDLQERRRRRDGAEPSRPIGPPHLTLLAGFAEELAERQQSFFQTATLVRERLDALHEQHLLLRESPDSPEKQEGLRRIREAYEHVREELHLCQQSLREQRADYHQLRLDYQQARQQVAAKRRALQQRQHEQRWHRYAREMQRWLL